MIFVRKFRFFMIFVLCLVLSLPVQASNQLTLYSHWRLQVTFDANGGVLTGGSTSEEQALAGQSSGSVSMSYLQRPSTSLSGSRTNFTFIGWNTQADGLGTWIEDFGQLTGPTTFYAIYYQSDYYYTGASQTFRVPVNGWYQIQCWGAKGGNDITNGVTGDGDDGIGGCGGYVSGQLHLTAGTELYVYVGQPGRDNSTGYGAGWNGGGNAGIYGYSGSGGGATDIRTVNGAWNQNLDMRIAVAAGGGGGGNQAKDGGYAGGFTGGTGEYASWTGGYGGTQSAGGAGYDGGGFGYGGSSSEDGGGGGGGWYGGGAGINNCGGGGGSSYLAGYGGCAPSPTGYVFADGVLLAGNQTMPRPDGGTEVGHSGECRARIRLVQRD